MVEFKIVISDPKSKKSYQKEVEHHQSQLMGKKIGDKFRGDSLGLTGYDLQITGGSDKDGFPMRSDIDGTARKKVLLTKGIGFHTKKKGRRKRKSIRGNTVSTDISQINTMVVTAGSQPLEKLLGGAENKEKKSEEAPKEEIKKEEPKVEKKQEEKSVEVPEPEEVAKVEKKAPEPEKPKVVEEEPKPEENKPEEK